MKTLEPRTGLLILLLIFFGAVSCSDDLEDELQDDLEQVDARGDDDDDDDDEDNDDDDEEDDDDDDDDDDGDDGDDDDDLVKHPSLYFVRLSPNISEDDVEDLLDDLNSEEVWFRDEINLRLWNTVALPYTTAQGELVTNVDGQIVAARSRARLNDVDFNYGSSLESPMASQNLFCFNNVSALAPVGNDAVKVSIFDSGIDENALQVAGYPFNGHTGFDYVDDDDEPNDENGHGTRIAGLIYSLVVEGQQAPNITFDIRKTHDAQGVGFVSNLIPAILDAVNEGAQILNFSFSYQDVNGDTQDRPLRLAIDYAEEKGALMVASAGNARVNNDTDSFISFPASYPNPNIISVASTGCEDKLSGFSSFGRNTVDLAYLGENIPTIGLNGNEVDKSGTSYTTAIVTAMATIMASQEGNVDNIKCSFIQTSSYSDDLKDRIASQGTIDFQMALSNMASCN